MKKSNVLPFPFGQNQHSENQDSTRSCTGAVDKCNNPVTKPINIRQKRFHRVSEISLPGL